MTARAIATRLALACMSLAGLGGCTGGVLDPHGPVALANHLILLNTFLITMAIVVPTLVATVAFAWWFRVSNTRARYRPDFVYSGRIELLVWSAPIITIVFIGGLIWIGSHELDPSQPISREAKPLEIEVVSLDWKWLFIYPEQGVGSVNELAIPAGVPVRFAITAGSVMNTFFVPELGSMIYAMNGMVTPLNLQADHPGDYYGESGMISGDGFSDMHFNVHAVTAAEFDAWVKQARQSAATLDRNEYGKLAKQSVIATPYTYGAVEPDLFQLVSTQTLPPAPGPDVGAPQATVHPTAEK